MRGGRGGQGEGERSAEGRCLYIASFLLWTITGALLRLYENYLRYNFNKRNVKTPANTCCLRIHVFVFGMRKFTPETPYYVRVLFYCTVCHRPVFIQLFISFTNDILFLFSHIILPYLVMARPLSKLIKLKIFQLFLVNSFTVK